jgi:hypothetical protein
MARCDAAHFAMQVQPVLRRLRKTLLVLFALFVSTVAAYTAVVPVDPYAAYSPEYLQDLPSDQWKAQQVRARVRVRARVSDVSTLVCR